MASLHEHPPAGGPIAVIGMGCLFPAAADLKAYWRLLLKGTDAITDVPATHWLAADYYDRDPGRPDHVYCTRGGFLPPIAFDPSEFGIPPSSLEATDTSQLLGLMAAKAALEDAGYGDGRPFDRDRTSVILGVTGTQELVVPLSARLGHPKWRRALDEVGIAPDQAEAVVGKISEAYVPWQENSFPGLLGNVVAGRICNRLDLGGTNCVVDAACASSLSAVHLALLELQSGRSDMVLSGGVDTLNDIFMHMCFAKSRVLSTTGDARPFSADADGTVLGEGIGILVFKRLADAENAGDRIYAVIKGIGSSSDGKSQSIYAPRRQGQEKALRSAYTEAGVDPATIGLVEAHGTGTRVGDRVEFDALRRVFEGRQARRTKAALGSVKSMIGHTKAAAGAAGMIKAILALHHRTLPPTLKVETPDTALDIGDSPFYLSNRARPWLPDAGEPRRAGVSAFGFGGSNFHVVLEEHPETEKEIAWDGSVELLALSGNDRSSITEKLKNLIGQLQRHPDAGAHLAKESRERFDPHADRRLLLVSDPPDSLPDDLNNVLHALESGRALTTVESPAVFYGDTSPAGKLAFLFPGQGSQYTDMGRELACIFPSALAALEKADGYFDGSVRLTDLIYPPRISTSTPPDPSLLPTEVAQPAIGAVSLAMLNIMRTFGVRPDATCGHSFGELTALHAAGWIDEDSFLKLSVARGRSMAAAAGAMAGDRGAMLAVQAPLPDLETLAASEFPRLVLANRNSPRQGVLSGPRDAVKAAARICAAAGYRSVQLPVGAAFHSKQMEGALAPFARAVEAVAFTPTQIPVFANSTAEPYPRQPEKASDMLARQLAEPVNFLGQIENLYRSGVRTFVEIGPKSVLSSLVRAILPQRPIQTIALDDPVGEYPAMKKLAVALCRLAAGGYPVQLSIWEQTAAAPRKSRMQVTLHGANFRRPQNRTVEKTRPGKTAAADKTGRTVTTALEPNPKSPVNQTKPRPAPRRSNSEIAPMKNENDSKTTDLSSALQLVQEGLKSMQAMQAQTASAHQKFLETQSEAGRTLQAMMGNIQRLMENGAGTVAAQTVETTAVENASAAPEQPENRPPETDSIPAGPVSTPPPPPEPAAPSTSEESHVSAAQTDSATGTGPLTEALLEVVSELTGYPLEMLGLEMDIEADLGIDSIKRVEILSTLEEKTPHLPPVSPEVMGTLKTLGEIVAHLAGPPSVDAPNPSNTPASGRPEATVEDRLQAGTVDDERLKAGLLAVVSELTGYPLEMLGLEMDIEADLGIDSIKRVEILSTLEEKMPDLPPVSPEVMGTLKTLGEIISCLSAKASPSDDNAGLLRGVQPPAARGEVRNKSTAARPDSDPARPHTPPARYEVKQCPYHPSNQGEVNPAAGRKIYVTDDRTGLAQAIVDELGRRGLNTVLVSPDILDFKAELPPAAGLILTLNPAADQPDVDIGHAFQLARHLAPSLIESAADAGAVFTTVSRLDGAFGLEDIAGAEPRQGALAGLAKTAALEWPEVCCHAIDLDPHWRDNSAAAAAVVGALLRPGPVEIGLSEDRQTTLDLAAVSGTPGELQLQQGDVVVISGGARGITAAAALELSSRVRPTLILLGRSAEPEPEPDWLRPLDDEKAIKAAIFANEFADRSVSPVQIEERYRSLMAAREISETLDRLRDITTAVRYMPADVRDGRALNEVFRSVRSLYGPVAAVIHGAGVLEDKLIVDKRMEQFQAVYDTKVKGLQNLLQAVGDDPLKYLVIFSSVTARMGNKGQADYAMANEALNKLAQREAARRVGCRVLSVNWGPWEAGMVTAALKREFTRLGVPLIPVAEGAASLVDEMAIAGSPPVEVVIGGPLKPVGDAGYDADTPAADRFRRSADDFSTAFEREIDLNSYPILKSHVIGGKAVVPLALMTEWICHGALHENPGLLVYGLDDIRVLKGIRFDGEKKLVRLLAGKIRAHSDGYEVDIEVRNGFQEGKDILHCRARAVLSEKLAPPPKVDLARLLSDNGYQRSAADIYADILFHGHQLHGIQKVISCSNAGMVARVSAAPDPANWMKSPLRNTWIADPLVLDSAFQMASLWCYEQHRSVSLPSYAASYRQYRRQFPRQGCTVALEVSQAGANKMRGEFTFLDDQNEVVALLTGFEAVMDPSLNRAFKPDFQTSN